MKLAWTMLSGVNTSREDARELAELTAGMPVRIDLIDVNDATGEFAAADEEERRAFRDALSEEVGMPVALALQRRRGHPRGVRHAGGEVGSKRNPAGGLDFLS